MAIDFEIDSQFVVQTEVEWGLDATIYPENSGLLISSDAFYGATDQRKFKIPNGLDPWDDLDYMPIGVGGSDKMIEAYSVTGNTNLADNTSYYFGIQGTGMGLNENNCRMVGIPAGEITNVDITTWVGSTFPTNEASTLKIVSDALGTPQVDIITSNLIFQTGLPRNKLTSVSVSLTPKAGASYLLLETPVGGWSTNPIAVQMIVVITLKPS